ncbi:hypothetical protein SEVIR_1G383200v4 [Setaria viridis]|uniref:Uncharacterized protein n=1 Tax=Setaria viridis TaxID=4556 RepID=A0A4U6WHN0_SETVI|nr:hypothetical protein SEVIR_1G383200v2 [Setaria viridis]
MADTTRRDTQHEEPANPLLLLLLAAAAACVSSVRRSMIHPSIHGSIGSELFIFFLLFSCMAWSVWLVPVDPSILVLLTCRFIPTCICFWIHYSSPSIHLSSFNICNQQQQFVQLNSLSSIYSICNIIDTRVEIGNE